MKKQLLILFISIAASCNKPQVTTPVNDISIDELRAPTAHIFTACKVGVDTHRVIFTCTKAIVNNLHLNVYDTITHQQYVSLAITQNGEQSKEFVFGESGYVSTCVYKIEAATQVLDRMKDKGEICNP